MTACTDNLWLLVAAALVGLCIGAIIALWWSKFSRERPLKMQVIYWEDRAARAEKARLVHDAWEHARKQKN